MVKDEDPEENRQIRHITRYGHVRRAPCGVLDVLTSDPYSAGVESRGEGKCFLGSAFFSVFHCIAFLLTSTGFSADFLYSLGVI